MAEATAEMTIDTLARETGMTVRNIRAHQSRACSPPPEVRARTGYYGPEHSPAAADPGAAGHNTCRDHTP